MSPCLLIRVENASSYGQSKTKEVTVCDIPQPIIESIKFFLTARMHDLETDEQSEYSFFPTAGLLLLLSASTTSLGRQLWTTGTVISF